MSVASAGRCTLTSSGFIALDVILGHSPRAAAGGTAANVAAAVSALGWSTGVVGVIGDDPAGRFVRADLVRAGVDVGGLSLDNEWKTPIVVQEPLGDDHVWRFACPVCGGRFAKHRPPPLAAARGLTAREEAPDVFFFDRVSLFTVELAERWKEAGALVVFEPSGLGRPHLFDRAARTADLVKYSSARAPSFEGHIPVATAAVRTEGEGGALFRRARSTRWQRETVPAADVVLDTAGAGDWTTAGLLTRLVVAVGGGRNAAGLLNDGESLRDALSFGQRLGRDACGWIGSRPPERDVASSARDLSDIYCPL